MLNTLTILQIDFIIRQMNIYIGLFIYITGLIGSLLNIIVFTSLKTFRETSCGFYLAVTSFFNVGQTLFALTTRILDSGFSINVTNVLVVQEPHISGTIVCSTLVDQYVVSNDRSVHFDEHLSTLELFTVRSTSYWLRLSRLAFTRHCCSHLLGYIQRYMHDYQCSLSKVHDLLLFVRSSRMLANLCDDNICISLILQNTNIESSSTSCDSSEPRSTADSHGTQSSTSDRARIDALYYL
jgi:hypothetical protein